MKFFVPTGVTGKAGEYYFAYWILRHFQWPCRILDIDVGIDAQVIELLCRNKFDFDHVCLWGERSIGFLDQTKLLNYHD